MYDKSNMEWRKFYEIEVEGITGFCGDSIDNRTFRFTRKQMFFLVEANCSGEAIGRFKKFEPNLVLRDGTIYVRFDDIVNEDGIGKFYHVEFHGHTSAFMPVEERRNVLVRSSNLKATLSMYIEEHSQLGNACLLRREYEKVYFNR